MFSTQSIFANPLFGISTRIEQIPIFPQILKSEKVEKNENLVKYLVGPVSGCEHMFERWFNYSQVDA